MITVDDLNEYAKQFLSNHFQIKETIPVIRNNRLRSTLGRYVYSRTGKPLRIELSGNLLTYGTKETIYSVLRHECIHFAFHIQGKNMRDGDPLFEKALYEFNAPSTKTLKVGKYNIFYCEKCRQQGVTHNQSVRKKPNHYRSKCCHAPIKMLGYRIYDGVTFKSYDDKD